MTSTSNAIQTNDLSRDFGEIKAVDKLNIQVPRGIVYGFLGPNGSGKTTTIHLLLGLIAATSGSASVLGLNVPERADEVRAKTGALLEHAGLYEQLSAEDNLEFYGRVFRMPPAERRERIRKLLTSMELWERRGDRVATWSKGMKQKLAIARAILHRPTLLFLDEPTAGLDALAANALREDLLSLVAEEDVTVFLTTHNLAEAERMCAQVAVINRGRLLTTGRPDELRATAGQPALEIKGTGFSQAIQDELAKRPEVSSVEALNGTLTVYLKYATDAAPIIALLVNGGAQIEGVTKGKATLEEAFVTLLEEDR